MVAIPVPVLMLWLAVRPAVSPVSLTLIVVNQAGLVMVSDDRTDCTPLVLLPMLTTSEPDGVAPVALLVTVVGRPLGRRRMFTVSLPPPVLTAIRENPAVATDSAVGVGADRVITVSVPDVVIPIVSTAASPTML